MRLVTALALAWAEPAGAEIRPGQDFVSHTWHADHGLPQNTVQAFCQTRDGFLWIGTRFGLARFDGRTFRAFRPTEVPEFRDGSISALAEDPDGTLWIGKLDGLLRLRGGQFHRVAALDGERVWALWAETAGRLWIGLNRGLVHIEARDPDPQPAGLPATDPLAHEPAPTHLRAMAPDGAGGLVLTTLAGWWRLDLASKRLSPWHPATPLAPPPPRHPAPLAHPTDWQARLIPDTASADFARDFFGQARLAANEWGPRTHADGAGGWWLVAANRALFHLDGQGLKRIQPSHPPAADSLLAAFSDREGNHWIGGAVSGLTCLRPRLFQVFPLGEASDASCFTVALDRAGHPWTASRAFILNAGSPERRLWRIDPGPFTRPIFALAPAPDGGWWLGWDRRGLFHWHPSQGDLAPRLVDLEGTRPRALTVTRDGALWIGCTTGLVRRHLDDSHSFGPADGLPHPDVRAIHEDRSGRLWIATFGGGIARREGDRFRPLTTRDGLASDTVWGFLEDRNGALWIYGLEGLTRWDGSRLATVTRDHGLFDDLTNQMLEDDSGHFWLGCNRGIYRVDRDELHAVADRRTNLLTSVVYTAADGLPIAETNGESQPAGARTADGALWFPTPVGLLRVDPRRVPLHETPPTVHFIRIRTESLVLLDENGGRLEPATPSDPPVRIPPGQAHVLEAEFTAPHFAAPERVRFRVRLHGYDTNWVEAGSSRSTRYTNLRPGRYRLEVTACNSHGLWAAQPATFAFALDPHLHQSPLFLPALATTLLLLGLALHRFRVRLVTRHHALQSELRLARERERIARDMHDDVGASLTQIGLLAARTQQIASSAQPALPPTVPGLLDRLLATNREAAQAMDEIVWALNPRNDRLDHLANYICQFAREYLEATGIRCRLEIPPFLPDRSLTSDQRHHLLMFLKECLGNAARHSGAREVRVRLQHDPQALSLTVADDGHGFPVPPEFIASRPSTASRNPVGTACGVRRSMFDVRRYLPGFRVRPSHPSLSPSPSPSPPQPAPEGNGLRHLDRRVAALGGTLRVVSSPGHGTTIEARLPLPP